LKIITHSADSDGHCCGALLKLAFPNGELIGINYGDVFIDHSLIKEGETIFMTDFSLQPFSEMIKLDALCDLIWIEIGRASCRERV